MPSYGPGISGRYLRAVVDTAVAARLARGAVEGAVPREEQSRIRCELPRPDIRASTASGPMADVHGAEVDRVGKWSHLLAMGSTIRLDHRLPDPAAAVTSRRKSNQELRRQM